MYSQLGDFDLSRLLQQGDERAFSEIYKRYWEKLYLIANKRLNDSAEAEEIVQDIFCKLWRRRDTFLLTKGFDNYFAVAVKFEVINRIAKKSRHAVLKKEISLIYTETDNSTVEDLNLRELKKQFQDLVNALPEKCRMVFKLRYEKYYTQYQIAQELHISEKTVEAHLAKVRKSLKGTLKIFFGLVICFLEF